MTMKRRKLKKFVLPSIYGLSVICIFLTVYFLNSSLNFVESENRTDSSVTVQSDNEDNSEVSVVGTEA